MDSVPFKKREPVQPEPYLRTAAWAASITLSSVRRAKVVHVQNQIAILSATTTDNLVSECPFDGPEIGVEPRVPNRLGFGKLATLGEKRLCVRR